LTKSDAGHSGQQNAEKALLHNVLLRQGQRATSCPLSDLTPQLYFDGLR
jgi:hypothetical protein